MNLRRVVRALAGSVAGAILAVTALGVAAPADAAKAASTTKGHGGITTSDTGWGYV